MKEPFILRDPVSRDAANLDAAGDRPLSIYIPDSTAFVRDSILLCNLLWAFPADMLLYLVDGPAKKVAGIWQQFKPERLVKDHIGIVSLSEASRMGLTDFFDRHGNWFDWYFCAFDEKHVSSVENRISDPRSFTYDYNDPLAEYARYSVMCNLDMKWTDIRVYDNQMIGPLINLLKSVSLSRGGS